MCSKDDLGRRRYCENIGDNASNFEMTGRAETKIQMSTEDYYIGGISPADGTLGPLAGLAAKASMFLDSILPTSTP